jgi:hypothetical protein
MKGYERETKGEMDMKGKHVRDMKDINGMKGI